MNFLVVLSCLSLALVTAEAQKPKPCVVPPLMTGDFSLSTGALMSTGKISYDTFGSRIRIRNFGMAGNKTIATDLLMLFNQKVYYEIDWARFSCKKKSLNATFIPMQVPADALLMGQVFIGSSSGFGMGVMVNTWYGMNPQNGMYMAVFTDVGCIPCTFMGYTPASGWTTVSTFNWVLGYTQPMDFFPPFFCAKSQLEEKEEADTFFTALESLAQQAQQQQQ